MTTGMETNLLNAARALASAGAEIDELFGEFAAAVESVRSSRDFSFKERASAEELPIVGWAKLTRRLTYTCQRKGKKGRDGQIGELNLVADLGRPNWPAERFGRPLLYVLWTNTNDTWVSTLDETNGDRFSVSSADYSLAASKLAFWHDNEDGPFTEQDFLDDPGSYAWLFVVPLMAITTRKMVAEVLLEPVISMIGTGRLHLAPSHPALDLGWQDGVLSVGT